MERGLRARRQQRAGYSYRGITKRHLEKLLREVADTVVNRRERLTSAGASTMPHAGGTQATRRTHETGERDPYTASYG
jgi:hypothetical protein